MPIVVVKQPGHPAQPVVSRRLQAQLDRRALEGAVVLVLDARVRAVAEVVGHAGVVVLDVVRILSVPRIIDIVVDLAIEIRAGEGKIGETQAAGKRQPPLRPGICIVVLEEALDLALSRSARAGLIGKYAIRLLRLRNDAGRGGPGVVQVDAQRGSGAGVGHCVVVFLNRVVSGIGVTAVGHRDAAARQR